MVNCSVFQVQMYMYIVCRWKRGCMYITSKVGDDVHVMRRISILAIYSGWQFGSSRPWLAFAWYPVECNHEAPMFQK